MEDAANVSCLLISIKRKVENNLENQLIKSGKHQTDTGLLSGVETSLKDSLKKGEKENDMKMVDETDREDESRTENVIIFHEDPEETNNIFND